MDPTTTVSLEVASGNERGRVDLIFGEWQEDQIEITFRERLHRGSGIIRLNGKNAGSTVRTSRPYTGKLADAASFNDYFGGLIGIFGNAYTFGWSPAPQQMVHYDADYHESNNYIQGDPKEIEIKSVQAKIIAEIASPKKCVIAGCSNGELVRQCRAMGMDAYGFDVIPNVKEIAFPEVRDYLKYGSLTSIPYSQDDNFDTLIAVDVLEHIPERDLPTMIDQWIALGVRKLVLLINLNQFWFPGHITLRPLSWWAEQWQDAFAHVSTTRQFAHLPSVYSNTGHYNQQWTVWERKK